MVNRLNLMCCGLLWLGGGCSNRPTDLDTRTTVAINPGSGLVVAQPSYDRVERLVTVIEDSGLIVDLYYPLIPEEQEGSFPLTILMQGADVERNQYVGFANRVAAYGFIVAVPNHDSLLGMLADLSSIPGTVERAAQEDADLSSPMAGRLDVDSLALLGHSFGGVGVLDAVNDTCRFPFCRGSFERPDNLVAISLFGTSQCNDGNCETTLIENSGVALQMIQGSLDGLVDAAEAAQTFERVINGPKQFVTVAGTNHFGINDRNNPVGAVPDQNDPTLEQAVAVETIARWTGMFLRAHMLDHPEALEYVAESGTDDDANASGRYAE